VQSCCGYPGRSLAPQDGLKTRPRKGITEMNARPNVDLVHGAWATAAVAVAATS